MMLQALIAYAEREGLGDADFESVPVRWQIPLDKAGKLAGGPIPLSEDPDADKPKPRRMLRPFTSPNQLNQGTKSHFLCDTLERGTLMLDPKTVEKAEARRVQHDYFKSLLKDAAAACPNDSLRLQAVLAFLQNGDALAQIHRQLTDLKAKPSDNAVFAVDGFNLLDSESLKSFWRNRRRHSTAAAGARERRVCIATGELAETLNTTEKIKGVPGGLATGTNLISFDKDSFCSFGLGQAQNAALSAPAELKIRSALNILIEKSRARKLVFNDTVCLHWTRKPIGDGDDPVSLLTSADADAVAELLKSFHSGHPPIEVEANNYYAMTLSGNGARIIVRDWLESTVPEIKRHVAEWFQDLSIIAPEGIGVRREFKLYSLLFSMVRAEVAELPPQIPTQLFHGALGGRSVPLPESILAAAVRRQQLDQENKLNPARLALIKVCLLRPQSASSPHHQTGTHTMTETLNRDSNDSAYLCGQLFAVFDRLQYLAQGQVNAGVTERYYASASVTPALVMGRLFRNAQFHLAKAGGGAAENVRKDFEEITCALGSRFKPTLTLEEQGRFALGYYHQKAEYRRRSAERKEQMTAGAAS